MMRQQALLVGCSDGIGLATVRRLLDSGWDVIGISRSPSPVKNSNYHHRVADVGESAYGRLLGELVSKNLFGLCIYFAGIGEVIDFTDMTHEARVIDVNLTGMVRTAAALMPQMVKNGKGHFIGVSSVADVLLSAEAPSYHASKAGFSNYLGGLALAARSRGVQVTNVRFGFVDTKMAKGDAKPFMMSVEKAVDHIERCIRKKPMIYTAPRIVAPLVQFRRFMMKLGAK